MCVCCVGRPCAACDLSVCLALCVVLLDVRVLPHCLVGRLGGPARAMGAAAAAAPRVCGGRSRARARPLPTPPRARVYIRASLDGAQGRAFFSLSLSLCALVVCVRWLCELVKISKAMYERVVCFA